MAWVHESVPRRERSLLFMSRRPAVRDLQAFLRSDWRVPALPDQYVQIDTAVALYWAHRAEQEPEGRLAV